MKQQTQHVKQLRQIMLTAILPATMMFTGTMMTGCGNNAPATDSTNTAMSDTTADGTAKPASAGIPDLKPKGAKPAWASDITDNMQVVIEKLESYGAKPIDSLSAVEARKNPTPTTAVMDVMKENNIAMPPSTVDTMGKEIPVNGGNIHARIYTPKNANSALPVIVYYHGGGWVIADLDTYDASAKGLAEQVGAVVVSVHYRQGPEHKFPVAHQDAFAAYQWVLKNAVELKVDSSKIAVVGESAGGNLAANVSMMARDKKIKMPLYEVLVYPVANNDMNNGSYTKYANAKPLNKPMMGWFAKNYLPSMGAAADPRISIVKANLKGMPPTTIITAEIDPLHDEGQMLSEKLSAAGVKVKYKNYDGVTHEFFGMATVLKEAKDAQALAASDLKAALK
jgi:acetyl esterase